jgi:hypothetical protein
MGVAEKWLRICLAGIHFETIQSLHPDEQNKRYIVSGWQGVPKELNPRI